MYFTQRVVIAAAATAVILCAGPAMAHGYNGNALNMIAPARNDNYSGAWPVTISGSQFSNGTGCLTLTSSGPSGGSATLEFGGTRYPYGSFLLAKDLIVATITEPLYGQNGALMFIASAKRGTIGEGVFEDIRGGSNFDFGKLAFGTKNGC
jgi:hypothetical protein